MGYDAYMVLGSGVQEAASVFVLTLPSSLPGSSGSQGEPNLWNPVTGQCFSIRDSTCELLQVGTIFNSENLWANIQQRSEPSAINYDFSHSGQWKPFITSTLNFRNMDTVQNAIRYEELPKSVFEDLELTVERTAMDAISSYRRRTTTHFHRKCSRILKELLKNMEEATVGMPPPASRGVAPSQVGEANAGAQVALEGQHIEALSQLTKTHIIVGCPIHMPYTDADAIRRAVLDTCVQLDAGDRAEFAVAAHIDPYGCSFVCSVWLYVAVLHRKP